MKKFKKSAAVAVCLLASVAMLFSGCTNQASPTSKNNQLTHLVWYVRGAVPNNLEALMAQANKILQQKMNAELELKFIENGTYNDKMQMIMASAEEYDIAFTSSWANNYVQNVKRGAFIPLDELIDKHPDLKKVLPQAIWDAVKVKNKIYAVPNYQVMFEEWGVYFRKDMVERNKIDISKINDLKDLSQVYQTIKENEPGVYPVAAGFPYVVSTPIVEIEPYIFAVDTKNWKVVDSSELLKDNYKLMREWYSKKYFPEDVVTGSSGNQLMKNGKVFSGATRMKPGVETELKNNYGAEFVVKSIRPAIISKNSVMSTLSAVSNTSKNPEVAVKLLELMNTDKELFNVISFGIEGQDYTKVGENKIQKIPNKYEFSPWMVGNQFNAKILVGQPDDIWEKTIKQNELAGIDPLLKFEFDRTPVENELNQMGAVRTEFEKILFNGLEDVDKILATRDAKLKAAGKDKVMAEMQKQLDAWKNK